LAKLRCPICDYPRFMRKQLWIRHLAVRHGAPLLVAIDVFNILVMEALVKRP